MQHNDRKMSLLLLYVISLFCISSAHDLLQLTTFVGDLQEVQNDENFTGLEPAIIELSPGQYVEGVTDIKTKQRRFLGIPFASPPVGALRWRASIPEMAWEGVRMAKKLGNVCVQNPSVFTVGSVISEDCLYLNVFTPPEGGSLKAVMVFFYGGSWEIGSGSCPLYFGGNMVSIT